MRRMIIAGNWKMNKNIEDTRKFIRELIPLVGDLKDIDIVIAPSYPALSAAAEAIKGKKISLAAQDVHWQDKGAFTGAVSAVMLKEVGVSHCIVGHSERRQHFGETDLSVNQKLAALLKWSIKPILCVGETLQERTAGQTFSVLENQLRGALKGITPKDQDEIIIAYEPVWAIGTGVAADPQQVQEAHAHIRNILRKLLIGGREKETRIQYGGSVTPGNARAFLMLTDVDGSLVGGASLNPASFVEIIKSASEAMKEKSK